MCDNTDWQISQNNGILERRLRSIGSFDMLAMYDSAQKYVLSRRGGYDELCALPDEWRNARALQLDQVDIGLLQKFRVNFCLAALKMMS